MAQYDANGTDRNNLFLDLHNNTYIEIAMSLSKSIFRKFHPKIAIPIIKENICNRELDIQINEFGNIYCTNRHSVPPISNVLQ